MEILSFKTVWGPNVYHAKPVVIMKIDLGQWKETSSADVPGFSDKLLGLLPGLKDHHCSLGVEGGFCQRLVQGTYMAHITEHVALELSQLAGIGVGFGKARKAGEPGHYQIITRFENEEGMKEVLRESVELVSSLLLHQEFCLPMALSRIRQTTDLHALGPSTESLLKALRDRDIPYRRLFNNSLYQLGYGKNRRFLQAAVTDETNVISTDLVQDKHQTKDFLARYSLPVPQGILVSRESELPWAMNMVRPPYVVKPFDGNHGRGVILGLQTHNEVLHAFRTAKKYSKEIMLEELCLGKDYRVLVVDHKVVAVAQRTPPTVEGDGQKTIAQLIEVLNQDPLRGEYHGNILSVVRIDEEVRAHLGKLGLNLESVLDRGQRVTLRGNANLSSGGTARDVTRLIHPEVRKLCERTARLLNLNICGIDLIHEDISRPVGTTCKIIEVNVGPGIRMHIQPSEGESVPVADKIIESIYPPGKESRIPIVSVTGTNGKTTVARLLKKILSVEHSCVGLTTTEGIWIGDECIAEGDTTGPVSTQTVLSDPLVDAAVLEVARGGILRNGLGYDWSDVGIITNITVDHIGQDGIEDLDDLIWIKSLVAERVRDGGWVVLNADDAASVSLLKHERVTRGQKKFMLYSVNDDNVHVRKHRKEGGAVCWIEKNIVCLEVDGQVYPVFDVRKASCTFGGLIEFQRSNLLAAVAGSFAMGVSVENIARSLLSFENSSENLGRMNFYKLNRGYALLDYGHNPAAVSALGKVFSQLGELKKTVIMSLPGDRSDDLLKATGLEVSQVFDEIYIKDDEDLRGRKPGEVPELVRDAIHLLYPDLPCHVCASEGVAFHSALENMRDDEIVVIFFDEFDIALSAIRRYGAHVMNSLPRISNKAFYEFTASAQG